MWTRASQFASGFFLFLALRWYWGKSTSNETFRGKNVVICGGSTGIGEQLAYRYSEHGANVMLVARRKEALDNVARNCSRYGASSATFVTADLSTIEGVKHVSEEALKQFGTIDILILNHVAYDVQSWHGNRNLSDVTRSFNTNVISYIALTTLFMPSLQASGGRLVVISSGLGVFTYPFFALYCSNKHALHGFFNALRQDLAMEETGDKKMSITLSVLGPIDTDNALMATKGNPVAGEKGWYRFSAVEASTAVLEASLRRERQLYFPSTMVLHEIASFHFPKSVEKLIRYTYGL